MEVNSEAIVRFFKNCIDHILFMDKCKGGKSIRPEWFFLFNSRTGIDMVNGSILRALNLRQKIKPAQKFWQESRFFGFGHYDQ